MLEAACPSALLKASSWKMSVMTLTVFQVNCNFPTDASFDRQRKIHAMVRDSNGFSIANFIIASFATHFHVLKAPTFFLLIICF
jgi:hypothetical protein